MKKKEKNSQPQTKYAGSFKKDFSEAYLFIYFIQRWFTKRKA